jgi:hypothetical protein
MCILCVQMSANSDFTATEFAYIEYFLDQKVAGEGVVDLIMNYLGDGLCTWCEKEAAECNSSFCEQCTEAFESLE